jgi:hypothetical protein
MPRQTTYAVLMIRLDKEDVAENVAGPIASAVPMQDPSLKDFDNGFKWASCKVMTLNFAHRQAKCGWLGSHSVHHRASRIAVETLEP